MINMINMTNMIRFDSHVAGYVPHDKKWIKTKVLAHLKRLAQSQ
jgi:hypothetical protein